jgi:hypothetical protein
MGARIFTLAEISGWLEEENIESAKQVVEKLLTAQIVTLVDGAAYKDWSG